MRRNSSAGAAAAVGATGAWHNVTSAPLRDITLLLSRCAPCYSPSSLLRILYLFTSMGCLVVPYLSCMMSQGDLSVISPNVCSLYFTTFCAFLIFYFVFSHNSRVGDKSARCKARHVYIMAIGGRCPTCCYYASSSISISTMSSDILLQGSSIAR